MTDRNDQSEIPTSEPHYVINVADNFHYQDASENYTLTGFASAAEALARCTAIVDSGLEDCAEEATTAEGIYGCYTMFGEDPIIIARAGAPEVRFSAFDYAKGRAKDFVRKGG